MVLFCQALYSEGHGIKMGKQVTVLVGKNFVLAPSFLLLQENIGEQPHLYIFPTVRWLLRPQTMDSLNMGMKL